jgi:hypothetical protein
LIVAVHALIGAVIGRASGHRGKAFAAGVASHLIADLLPHKDFPFKVEAPLMAVTLGFLAWRFGPTSPEVFGACGAVAPDGENALVALNVLPEDAPVFPTHRGGGANHGPKVSSALPQGVIAAACLAYLLWNRRGKRGA